MITARSGCADFLDHTTTVAVRWWLADEVGTRRIQRTMEEQGDHTDSDGKEIVEISKARAYLAKQLDV